LKVYYDQFEDGLAPVWMLLPINTLEWQLERFYVSLSTPFEQFTTDDFDTNQLYVSVHIEDLIRNWKERESIGISLSSILQRFKTQKSNNEIDEEYVISDIEHMVVRMSDIEEVLQMNIRSYYDWR
jgi:hypothetical protein